MVCGDEIATRNHPSRLKLPELDARRCSSPTRSGGSPRARDEMPSHCKIMGPMLQNPEKYDCSNVSCGQSSYMRLVIPSPRSPISCILKVRCCYYCFCCCRTSTHPFLSFIPFFFSPILAVSRPPVCLSVCLSPPPQILRVSYPYPSPSPTPCPSHNRVLPCTPIKTTTTSRDAPQAHHHQYRIQAAGAIGRPCHA